MATLNYCGITVLPIELISFNAIPSANDNNVNLTWETASETNSDYFIIEKSKDGKNWNYFTKVKAAGNSNKHLLYNMEDNKPYGGVSYYRLKQVDFNGKFTYSDIKEVNVGRASNSVIYPNPGTGLFKLVIDNGLIMPNSEIIILDVLGNIIYKNTINPTDDVNLTTIDISKESKGIYFYKVISNEQTVASGKLNMQ